MFLHKLCWFPSLTGLGTALPRQYWNKARNALASWSPGLCWLAGQWPDAAGRQQAWHYPPMLSGGWTQVTCPWQHSWLARSLSAAGHPSMELLGKGSFRRPWYTQTGPFTVASSRSIEAIIYYHIHTLVVWPHKLWGVGGRENTSFFSWEQVKVSCLIKFHPLVVCLFPQGNFQLLLNNFSLWLLQHYRAIVV